MSKLIYVDVETTGLTPPRHRVLEVGWAEIPDGDYSRLTLHERRFRPTEEILAQAEPKALEVNGYYTGHPDWEGTPYLGTPEAVAVWQVIAEAFAGASFCNQNIAFDLRFLEAEWAQHMTASPVHGNTESTCTRPMAKRIQQGSTAPGLSASLHPIYDYLKGPALPPHRGASDVLRAIWLRAHHDAMYLGVDTTPMLEAVRLHASKLATVAGC